MLNTLLHIKTVTKANFLIGDGEDGICRSWECATANALQSGSGSGENRPANQPVAVAANYEYFGYSARAARLGCSWTGYVGHAWGSVAAVNQVVDGVIVG